MQPQVETRLLTSCECKDLPESVDQMYVRRLLYFFVMCVFVKWNLLYSIYVPPGLSCIRQGIIYTVSL